MGRKEVGTKLLKWVLSSGLIALLLYYAGKHAITISEATKAFAGIPVLFVLFIELLDKYTDMGKLYGRFGKDKKSVLGGLIFGGIGFGLIVWAITGTLKLSGTTTPAAVLVAGFTALYIFAPDTGRDEWYFMAWLGATIATMGHYFHILPGSAHLLAMLLNML